MLTITERFREALRHDAPDFRVELNQQMMATLSKYYELLFKWNDRLHLVAPSSPEEFAARHVLESLMLLPHLKADERLVDVGSGAGLPAIPCLIARRDVNATLIEASTRKSVFLREALRVLGIQERAKVIAGRFEKIEKIAADVFACRALGRFEEMLPQLVEWAPASSKGAGFVGGGLKGQVGK